jgi:ferric-dicitrate binding protein FerR (iron transport regulator)
LRTLLDHLFDVPLSTEQTARLNQLLDASETARRHYLKYVGVHSALTTTAGCHARASVDEFIDQLEQTACNELAAANIVELPFESREPSKGAPLNRRWLAAVAASAAVVMAGWFGLAGRSFRQTNPPQADATTVSARMPDIGPIASQVTYLSPAVRWRNPNLSFALESVVRAGERLIVEHGQVELTYSSGTKLLLTGPSEFLVGVAGGSLVRGELVARVPKAGHGFTIDTPHGKVIDLGTEFGVVVDDFGVSQVNVYEGRVETLPTVAAAKQQEKIELTQGRALQLSRDSVVPMHARGGRYKRPGYDSAADQARQSPAVIDQNFYDEALDQSFWKPSGPVAAIADGVRFSAAGTSGAIPRLVSRQEFDPAEAPIRIVCELRFVDVRSARGASFAILTRAADQPSKPGTDWQDILAACMRCSLSGNPGFGDGILKAGAKYEADRELSNISWAGFAGLQSDALYRLEMCDDGLNVEFTVSQVANPAIRKSIKCRSLFRGGQNVIALEGSRDSTTIIERVRILQQPMDKGDQTPAESTRSLAANNAATGNDAVTSVRNLVPIEGRLVLADDFSGPVVNVDKWLILDDVEIVDGQLQLGLPNAASHIDTWKARPYLLTKQEFDPARTPLTIVGRMTFSDNFLHGYGGSFAIMTRSDNRHGSGEGWENSILGRGVRSNFWPAAIGEGRNVELFEKSPQTPIALLTNQRFEIDPQSRTYLFRVVDDGRSATLTLVDAANPANAITATHATTAASQFGGHVALEGCWGSPVLLDDVSIYATDREDRTAE